MPIPMLTAPLFAGFGQATGGGILGSIAGGISSLVSGLTGGFNAAEQSRANKEMAQVSRENTEKTLKYQREAADLAWNRDLQSWHMRNAYEGPAAQMGRLKQAGLNPFLVYGTGSPAGTSSPAPSMGTPNYQAQYQARPATQIDPTLAMSAGGIANTMADLQIKQAQKSNIEAATRSTNVGISLDSMEATMKAIDVLYKQRGKSAETRSAEAGAGMQEQELRNLAIKQFLENQRTSWDVIQKSREDFQSKSLFPYQLQVQQGAVNEQRERIRSLTQGISSSKTSQANTEADTVLKKLQKTLGDQDLKQKEWENFLRSKNLSPTDNPISLSTRYMGQFLQYLINKVTE